MNEIVDLLLANEKITKIDKEIDQMEKSKINVTDYRKKSEHFWPFALAAAAFLMIEFLLKNIVFKSVI